MPLNVFEVVGLAVFIALCLYAASKGFTYLGGDKGA